MAEPTKTRKQLRRAVSKASKSRFFRTYSDGEIPLSGTPSAISLPSTDYLVQGDNYWKNSFVYVVETQEERPISDFDNATAVLTPEYPFTAAPDSTDSIEIHDRWSPGEIHDAINWSIEEAGKKFPDSVEDETLILLEDKLQYDISGLSEKVWMPLQVWIERTATSMTGTATAGTTDSITVPSGVDLSSVDTDWKVSIYCGTGSQQVADVTAVSTTTQIISAMFDTAPSTDSKYRLWDAAEEKYVWEKIAAVKFDQLEFPTYIRFASSYSSLLGMRMRLVYLSVPSVMDDDADTTVIPEQYIVHKSLSYLHDLMVQDVRADRQMHANAAEYHEALADKFMALHIRRRVAGTWWQEEDNRSQAYEVDPMGWGS